MPKKVVNREYPPEEPVAAAAQAPVVSAPAAPVAPSTPRKKRAKKEAFDRGAYQYAVWTGAGASPKFWAKDMDAVKAYLGTVKPAKLANVHVGEIKSVKVETNIQIDTPVQRI